MGLLAATASMAPGAGSGAITDLVHDSNELSVLSPWQMAPYESHFEIPETVSPAGKSLARLPQSSKALPLVEELDAGEATASSIAPVTFLEASASKAYPQTGSKPVDNPALQAATLMAGERFEFMPFAFVASGTALIAD